MGDVVIALIPALHRIGTIVYGTSALIVTGVSVAACVAFEYLIQRFMLKGPVTIGDYSAVVTGLLLGFNLPSSLPVWIVLIGALVAVGVGKMSFGGSGKKSVQSGARGTGFPADLVSRSNDQLCNSVRSRLAVRSFDSGRDQRRDERRCRIGTDAARLCKRSACRRSDDGRSDGPSEFLRRHAAGLPQPGRWAKSRRWRCCSAASTCCAGGSSPGISPVAVLGSMAAVRRHPVGGRPVCTT